jgi:hypothetical protein
MKSYSFIIFGITSMVSSLFILIYVPETKNKTIEELIKIFNNK